MMKCKISFPCHSLYIRWNSPTSRPISRQCFKNCLINLSYPGLPIWLATQVLWSMNLECHNQRRVLLHPRWTQDDLQPCQFCEPMFFLKTGKLRATQGDTSMGSKEERCGVWAGTVEFSLLRSNHASDSVQPSFISRAIGCGEVVVISISIVPWNKTFPIEEIDRWTNLIHSLTAQKTIITFSEAFNL